MRSNIDFFLRPALVLSFVAALLVSTGSVVTADDGKSPPTASALIEALQSKGPTRGVASPATAELIKSLKDKNSRGLSISSDERDQLAVATKNMPAYDMDIPFDFNSDEISDRARPAIKALAEALQDTRLTGANFVVAGHTDGKGGLRYNQRLSERRAEAVKKTLINEYSISREQLIAVGYGPQQLKNQGDPNAEENRRVQIVNVGE